MQNIRDKLQYSFTKVAAQKLTGIESIAEMLPALPFSYMIYGRTQ